MSMGNGNFDADAETTQGMMEQILYNIDGGERAEPAEGENWWTAADNWAAGGVTEGLGEAHDPSAPATRAQVSAMAERFCEKVAK